VNRGGEKISCAEVESALFEHPAVVESAVFAVPESRLGEEVRTECVCVGGAWPSPPSRLSRLQVGVAIVVRAGWSLPSLEDLHRTCTAAGLAKFKLPTRVWQWPAAQLPRGATGKTLKREVREWAVKSLLPPAKL
jgi:acyl-CoA synthetase (AMP-forming)/AMP-acid ligase II